jgi:DnaK suppressor protein
MDQTTIDEFRGRLEERRAELLELEQTRKVSQETVELDQTRQGRLSRMDALQLQAMAQATGARADLQLRRIDAALARCESGDYGLCMECGEEIAHRRLMFDPTTTRCVSCAQARERGER